MTVYGVSIGVPQGDIIKGLNRLKRKLKHDNTQSLLRLREKFPKPSERKREKERLAEIRLKRKSDRQAAREQRRKHR